MFGADCDVEIVGGTADIHVVGPGSRVNFRASSGAFLDRGVILLYVTLEVLVSTLLTGPLTDGFCCSMFSWGPFVVGPVGVSVVEPAGASDVGPVASNVVKPAYSSNIKPARTSFIGPAGAALVGPAGAFFLELGDTSVVELTGSFVIEPLKTWRTVEKPVLEFPRGSLAGGVDVRIFV